jgi:RNA polymerase sigma factor (TIGR02999 family)
MTPETAAPTRDGGLTVLLAAAARGDRRAFDRAFALLYDELAVLARAQRRWWVGNETLSTTVLVHEAYLKLVGGEAAADAGGDAAARWEGRRHFFALAAQVMRHLLVNYAERQRAAKRGGDARPVPLDALADPAAGATPDLDWLAEFGPSTPEAAEEVLALHAALLRLEAEAPRQARIVECRFFAGLSIPETAEALGISAATVKRDWQVASEWLHREIAGG